MPSNEASLKNFQDNVDPQVVTGTDTPTGNKAYGSFLTANGNIITPNVKKTPFKVPFIDVTPAPTLQAPTPKNLDTAKQDNNAHYNEQRGHVNPDNHTPPYQNQASFKLYSSNILDKRFKINTEDIKIPPELAPLKAPHTVAACGLLSTLPRSWSYLSHPNQAHREEKGKPY